jgi:hypothetical protein
MTNGNSMITNMMPGQQGKVPPRLGGKYQVKKSKKVGENSSVPLGSVGSHEGSIRSAPMRAPFGFQEHHNPDVVFPSETHLDNS